MSCHASPDALTLNYRETWSLLGISERQFRKLKAEGRFDHLEAPLPRRYSRVKVEAFINGKSFLGLRRIA